MPDFLLEIGFEEMPSRFLGSLCEELRQGLARLLEQNKLGLGVIDVWATPRRLAALVHGLDAMQRQEEVVATGPPVKAAYDASGNPTAAALGFAKGHGVDIGEVFTMNTPKGDYLAVRKTTGGVRALELLPDICPAALKTLNFPKKMHWGSLDYTFGRPIRWIVALLDEEIVPFKVAGVASGRGTRGHRVMGPGPFELACAAEYRPALREKGHVILDPVERRASIIDQCEKAALSVGGRPIIDERHLKEGGLLEEVCGLVEYPLVILGGFDPRYLELPREVLLTSMETHQKSFGVEEPRARDKLLPYFLTTAGLKPTDVGLVRKGWERVLRARLEDARFFWETDLAANFDAWLDKLDSVTFLAPLGSMGKKSSRIEDLCDKLAQTLRPDIALDVRRAGRLCKADLVSEMVGEFSDLQGIMGGIYARKKRENERVAKAIYEHYLPLGPESPVPSSPAGAILAIADKMDTLAGCFGLDMIPTGAADPYALRRQALGICRIIIEHRLRLDLSQVVEWAFKGYSGKFWPIKSSMRWEGRISTAWQPDQPEVAKKLLEFFEARLKAWYVGRETNEGITVTPQVADAALGAGFADVSDVWALDARITALARFSVREDFGQSVLTFKRAANIIRKQAAGMDLTGEIDPSRLAEPAEKKLVHVWAGMAQDFDDLFAKDDFEGALDMLGQLRPAVDGFFDGVMVMCEDEAQKMNRLNILKSIVDRLGRLADFAALQV